MICVENEKRIEFMIGRCDSNGHLAIADKAVNKFNSGDGRMINVLHSDDYLLCWNLSIDEEKGVTRN